MAGPHKVTIPAGPSEITIENLSHEGAGIARQADGKTIFIADALPGERVRYRRTQRKRDFDQGQLLKVLESASGRVTPPCPHFGVCGGCSLQHLDPPLQVEFKQQSLLDTLARVARLQPEQVLPPLVGARLGYRRRARLTVRYNQKTNQVQLGFQQRDSRDLVALDVCLVLNPVFGERLPMLVDLLGSLDIRVWIADIEVAVGDQVAGMALRVLRLPTAADRELLMAFSQATGIGLWLQHGNDIQPLMPGTPEPSYRLPAQNVEIHFAPNDFVQVNGEINRLMVDQALALLDLRPHEMVLDLFAGLGNFSLPMARQARRVVAVEGDRGLVERATRNALANGLENIEQHLADLNATDASAAWLKNPYDAVLLDPPRAGAREILPRIATRKPKRILYVSCHPGTLARDAAVLAQEHGYRLRAAGIMDMFPHTSHVESMVLFERAADIS